MRVGDGGVYLAFFVPTQLNRFSSRVCKKRIADTFSYALNRLSEKQGKMRVAGSLDSGANQGATVGSMGRVEKSASLDLRAPETEIDGRLRRVIPMPAMATEGESRAGQTHSTGNRVPVEGQANEGAAVLSGLTKG